MSTPKALTESATSKYLQTAKWKLHYNEAGDGHPLVLLHGGGPGASGWSNYSENIDFFARHYRVFAIDMPGWGKSDTAEPGDRDHVEALGLALDALGLDRVALIGNSMGGATTLRFTAEHPERVSHLVPMGANAPGTNMFGPPNHRSEGIRAIGRAYFDPSPANFQAMVGALANDPALAEDADLAQRRSEAALARPDHLENWKLSAPRGELNGPPQLYQAVPRLLGGLTVPTLLVHGRDDRAVPLENSLRLLAMIPSARLYVINNCGHWAQMEHPEEFNRVVHEFISAN
ncbi:alpha/beta hydrolase [Streptomyces sp. ID05-04B]|uniref:alpha/beta fold hydrolase n=1 Tax=unclassified Streptomyces TaxID=2593676 RepID=UPI000D1B01F0|nr:MULTISPECIES: alpha/beta hydrolase [unclassified Streptomyces]AVV44211.1 alpha/beta hydrolase [Streptomyces sp. P3]MDX5568141.1 alpha/beta hydrolase [Streptomyces sp. ID05-04B]